MAASESIGGPGAPGRWLAPEALRERLEEEISRCERQGTELACLLVVVENLAQLADAHGAELAEQAPRVLAAALEHQLRRYDAIGRPTDAELAVLLPGADGARAEVAARRALERMRAIKVEVSGGRIPLQIAVGLASWREGVGARGLLQAAREAAELGR